VSAILAQMLNGSGDARNWLIYQQLLISEQTG
jgi:hypothetical protein